MNTHISTSSETRRLIVSGNSQDKVFLATLEKLKNEKAQLDERDVEVVTRRDKKFSARLIGKDGTQKWKKETSFEIKEITELIDQMPMRQSEMKEKKKGP